MTKTNKRWIVPAALSLLAGCAGAADPTPTPTTPAATAPAAAAQPMIPGYAHSLRASQFHVGANPLAFSQKSWHRTVGDEGFFAVNEVNGATLSLAASRSPGETLPSLFDNADAHNQFTLNYFQQAGIPKDQIAGVHALYEGEGHGSLDEKHEMQDPVITGFYSVLTRAIDGVAVPDSYATARFVKNGAPAMESVYWPELPKAVVEQAKTMRDNLADPVKGAAIKAMAPGAHISVAIRHSSMAESVRPTVLASYEALVSQSNTGYHRHFDMNLAEFKLSGEERQANTNFVGREVANELQK